SRSNWRPVYEIVECHGVPVAHDGMARPSLSGPLATELSRMMLVLVRMPETCGQVSVDRITSANSAVLLVPSVMATSGIPFSTVPPDTELFVKMPAPGPVVPNCEVAPRHAR